MDLEFISASEEGRHKGEFLVHMADLQNISFSKGDTFIEVVDRLKSKNTELGKHDAINEWFSLNSAVKEMTAEDVFGLPFGVATFNFRK